VPFTYIEAKLQARRACRILRLGLTQRLALIDWMRLIDDSRGLPKAHGSEEVLQKAKTLLISFRLMCITWAMNHVVWSRCISLQYVKREEMTDSGWLCKLAVVHLHPTASPQFRSSKVVCSVAVRHNLLDVCIFVGAFRNVQERMKASSVMCTFTQKRRHATMPDLRVNVVLFSSANCF
jgi:hypothetical protein